MVSLEEGLKKAEESGLDLVEVSPEKDVPVCRILDYGKLKYQQKKKTQQKKHTQALMKEIRITPKIGEHDIQVKIRQALGFLQDGNKVLVTMTFRGREVVHMDRALELMKRIATELATVSKLEKEARLEGHRMSIILAPGGAKKSETPS